MKRNKKLNLIIQIVLIPFIGLSQTYSYDALNRLSKVQYGNGTVIEYAYDQVGNRESKVINGTAMPKPDIAPLGGSISVTSGSVNSSVTITWTENNLGSSATTAAYNSIVALSSDDIYQAGTDVQLAIQSIATAFASGGSQSLSKTVTIPANTAAGAWKILIVSDANNGISEISETNNTQSLPFTVVGNCSGFGVSFSNLQNATCGQINGSVAAQAASGFGTVTFQWSNGVTAPSIFYQNAGNYSVTATSTSGCTAINTATIGITPSPSPLFNFSVSNFTSTFVNISSNTTSYLWNFGDGTTSTDISPNKTYNSAGNYNVCLTGYNSNCPSISYCQNVAIEGNGCSVPSAIFSSNISNTTATLSWASTFGASNYNIRYRMIGNATWTMLNNITANTYNLFALSAGSTYEYQVESVCGQGNSGYTFSQYFTTTGLSSYGTYYKLYDFFPNSCYVPEHDFIKTTDNKCVMAGYTGINGFASPFIYKIDPNTGNTIFSKSYTFTSSGGSTYPIYNTKAINGKILSIMRTVYNNGNSTSYNILELNETGDITKNKSVQPTTPVTGHTLERQQIISNNNNTAYYYTGDYQNGPSSFNLVSKLDTNLNVIWSKRIGISANYLSVRNLLATSDGGLLISIEWLVFEGFIGNNYVIKYRSNLFKLSSNGVVEWVRQLYTDDKSIQPRRVTPVETATGYFLVYGSSVVTNNINNSDQILIKFNKVNGDIIWTKFIDGLSDICSLSNNSILLTTASNHQFLQIDENGNIIQNKKGIGNKLLYSLSILNFDSKNFLIKGRSNISPTKECFHLMKIDSTLSNCTTSPGNLTIQNVLSDISITPNFPQWTTLPFDILISNQTNFSANNLTGNVIDECPVICNTTAAIAPLSTTSYCMNQDISVTSISTGATSYSWYKDDLNSASAATGNSATISFSTSGTHKIYLVATNGNCSSSTFVTVNINENPSFTVTTNQEICNEANGIASVQFNNAAPNAIIQWSNGSNTNPLGGLKAGTYTVVATLTNGCSGIQNFTITNTSAGFTVIDTINQITCYGLSNGSIKLGTTNAIAPITYQWDNQATTRSIQNLSAKFYKVTISDGAGCIQNKSYSIIEPQKLEVTPVAIDVITCNGNNGMLTATPNGGTVPYSYLWNNGQTTQTAIGLAQNNYYITVTDSKGCTARNTGTVGTINRKGKVFYSHPSLAGISNAVLHRGQIALMVAKEPMSKFPGYPDTLSQFVKVDLINESSTLYNLETSSSAAHLVHGNVALTPDGKLSVVYQAPTGTSYGFRGMHRIYDCGSTLALDEQVFTNANWGAWMRHVEQTNKTKVISFAHAGYLVKYFVKDNGTWVSYNASGSNNYLGELSMTSLEDSLYYSGNFSSANPNYLRQQKIYNLSQSTLNFATIKPQNNCDIQIYNNTNRVAMLYNQGDTLRLLENTNANSWVLNDIIYQRGIGHRASLYYRSNGNAVVSYQTYDKVVVMERSNNIWAVKYVHNNLVQSEQLGGTRAPSLLLKNGDLWIVYADGYNVYKYNIDLPCNYVQLVAKVYLQGPYNSSTGLMNDNLRSLNLIPNTEPYTAMGFTNIGGGGETLANGLYNCTTGDNAIVDWVFLELRNKNTPTTVVATRSALIQRDGDIVDLDGISPVVFKNVVDDNYYIRLRHRSHLAIRSAVSISLNKIESNSYNFSDSQNKAYQNITILSNQAMKDFGGGKYGMWNCNVNGDEFINIIDVLQTKSQSTPNQSNVYKGTDTNMDGNINVIDPIQSKSQSTPNKSSHN